MAEAKEAQIQSSEIKVAFDSQPLVQMIPSPKADDKSRESIGQSSSFARDSEVSDFGATEAQFTEALAREQEALELQLQQESAVPVLADDTFFVQEHHEASERLKYNKVSEWTSDLNKKLLDLKIIPGGSINEYLTKRPDELRQEFCEKMDKKRRGHRRGIIGATVTNEIPIYAASKREKMERDAGQKTSVLSNMKNGIIFSMTVDEVRELIDIFFRCTMSRKQELTQPIPFSQFLKTMKQASQVSPFLTEVHTLFTRMKDLGDQLQSFVQILTMLLPRLSTDQIDILIQQTMDARARAKMAKKIAIKNKGMKGVDKMHMAFDRLQLGLTQIAKSVDGGIKERQCVSIGKRLEIVRLFQLINRENDSGFITDEEFLNFFYDAAEPKVLTEMFHLYAASDPEAKKMTLEEFYDLQLPKFYCIPEFMKPKDGERMTSDSIFDYFFQPAEMNKSSDVYKLVEPALKKKAKQTEGKKISGGLPQIPEVPDLPASAAKWKAKKDEQKKKK